MVELLNRHFQQLIQVFDEILEIKKNHQSNLTAKRTKAVLLFVGLKHSNRDVKYKIKDGREELYLEKSKVDVNRLQLQNLLYEVNHLKREIVSCHKFKSRDASIDLLSEEDYVSLGIPETHQIDKSGHGKHLVQLKYELGLRKELSSNYKNLLTAKQQLYQEILNKTDRYAAFAPALRTLRDSSRPLHDALQMTLEADWNLSTVLQYLPKQLYLLYMNLKALQITGGFYLKIEINGLESNVIQRDMAAQFNLVHKKVDSKGKSKNEESLVTDALNLEPHPLSLCFTIGKANMEDHLIVEVYFFESLGLATAKGVLSIKALNEIEFELPSTKVILDHLYADDFGNEILLNGDNIKIRDKDVDEADCLQRLEDKKYGKPYRWLQNVCGITTFKHLKSPECSVRMQQLTREMIIKMRTRWALWVKLIKQIRGLSLKDVDLYSLKANTYPGGLSSSFVQWTSIPADEFESQLSDALCILNRSGIVYSYFRAVVVRGSAKMECFIRISSRFPLDAPLWIICVHWNGRHTSSTNTAVKTMEYWTNSLSNQNPKSGLLYAQLLRTMYSFDIFLETESSMQYFSHEYNKEKPYICAFSKRLRLRPYKFVKKGSVFSFKQ